MQILILHFTKKILNNLSGKHISEFNKYEKEQFAEIHSRFANPLYIFSFALIPLLIRKFSKKPGDNLFLPIAAVSSIAFIFQIIQITMANILVDKSNLVFVAYILPIIFLGIIILVTFLDDFKVNRANNAE